MVAKLNLEHLESRLAPATTAMFNGSVLTVTGDARDNDILVYADRAGGIRVTDGQSVAITSIGAQRINLANTTLIQIEGKGGDDRLVTDASLNTLVGGVLADAPDAVLLGGQGDDFLLVGHGGIVGGLGGVDANGRVVGRVVGNAFMDGGAGNDSLVSGFGNDVMRGGAGNDSYLWPPGTLNDVWDGGPGNDTVTIVGNDTFLGQPANDAFVLTANGNRALFQRTNLVQFSVDIGSTENIVLRPGAGDDVVTIGNLAGVRSLESVQVIGGDGNDVVIVDFLQRWAERWQ